MRPGDACPHPGTDGHANDIHATSRKSITVDRLIQTSSAGPTSFSRPSHRRRPLVRLVPVPVLAHAHGPVRHFC